MSKGSKKNFDGVQSVADLLKVMGKTERERLLQSLEERDPGITSKIKEKLFVFENLAQIESPGLQLVLREIPAGILPLALRNASEEVRAAVMNNLSNRAAKLLQEELDQQGPQKLSKVTEAQREIIKIAEKLLRAQKISIRK